MKTKRMHKTVTFAALGLICAIAGNLAGYDDCGRQYSSNYTYSPGPPCILVVSDIHYVCRSWDERTNCVPDFENYPGQPIVCEFTRYTGQLQPDGSCNFIMTQEFEDVCWPKVTEDCPDPYNPYGPVQASLGEAWFQYRI